MKGRVVLRGRALLAFAGIAGIGLAGAGTASAGLNDRAGDPVVFTGKDVPGLIGTAPSKVVAFAWHGKWKQIPVQVDERKTIDVRTLYPTPGPPYVRLFDSGFDLKVYADPDTRTGPDHKAWLDGDDEIALMAQDAGSLVKSGRATAPGGTAADKATVVTVEDPLDGGKGYVYLFRAKRKFDQSAGKTYVDYKFRPLYLAPGQRLLDGYRYANSPNPENSTVKTDFYSTHSTDRWMDDQIRVKAGDASGVDILDREVAQATRTRCGRSELTFSGNWTAEDKGNDTDEGTFVAVKSGPIRAIRDYMGANSGPYTQRQHIYYQRREDNTTFLRVHSMLDLYEWTDYAAAATGMTYRDQVNTAGVPVDGTPDVLTQPDTGDFIDGQVFWQQLSGSQGTVSTIASAETDLPTPNFGSYYLDNNNTPLADKDTQCAGDGASYGSSGFGILGPVTPNTDPRLPVFNSLTVNRVRYFGSPEAGGASKAEALADRVRLPLEVSSGTFRPRVRKPLSLTAKPSAVRVSAGKPFVIGVKVRNRDKAAARNVLICVVAPRILLSGPGCFRLKGIKAKGSVRRKLKMRVGKGLPLGSRSRITVSAGAEGLAVSKRRAVVRVVR